MDVRLIVRELGPQTGGIGRYVTELQRGLGKLGVRMEMAEFRYLPGASRRHVLKSVPVGINGRFNEAIVHIPRIFGSSMLLFRRPRYSVVTVHDLGALFCPEDRAVGNTFDRLLLHLSLAGMRRADRIVASSEFTKQCLVNSLGYDQSCVDAIPLGVDRSIFRRLPNARAILSERHEQLQKPQSYVILYVGSEQPRKSLGTLVRALSRLKHEGVPFFLLKVGASDYLPSRQALKSLIDAHGLTEDVILIDRVSDADLPLFYSAADVFVQPSVYEGFGLPVLEAMACGTPVVTTEVTSLPEVVGDAALLVGPRDPGALAEMISRMLRDESLAAALSERGLKRAALFSWDRTARSTISSYTTVTAMEVERSGEYHDQLA